MVSTSSTLGRLLERVILVTLVTVVAALGMLLLFSADLQISAAAIEYVLLSVTGLAAGFSSRYFLAGRSTGLRAAVVLFALCAALWLASQASQGAVGIDPLRQYVAQPARQGGIALALSSAAAWLALSAFAPRRTEILVEPRAAIAVAPSPPPPAVRPARRVRSARPAPRRSIRTSFVAWRDRARARLVSLLPGPTVRRPARRRVAAPAKPARPRRTRRRPAVHFSGAETHVCPYCLEVVTKRDSRGVKICKVCKTWHHADCWEVTGVCQVPHQYVD
ncbi:MAG: hypothetical protein KIS85_08130 [Anaerolineales bacterium]|nr:hypothetical protein [Anaerolineales bacterium]